MPHLSDSARSTSAAESRFRVQDSNSLARDILVIALDEQSAALGGMLAAQSWRHAEFVNFHIGGGPQDRGDWAEALERHGFDLIVMVGTAGSDLRNAEIVGGKGIARGVKVSSVLLSPQDTPAPVISESLLDLRPWSRTLALIGSADYLPGVLHALGA
jgi:hypothetical protein